MTCFGFLCKFCIDLLNIPCNISYYKNGNLEKKLLLVSGTQKDHNIFKSDGSCILCKLKTL